MESPKVQKVSHWLSKVSNKKMGSPNLRETPFSTTIEVPMKPQGIQRNKTKTESNVFPEGSCRIRPCPQPTSLSIASKGSVFFCLHDMHVFYGFHVGKYTSPMDGLAYTKNIKMIHDDSQHSYGWVDGWW